jgi:ATP-dependent Clp protease adaptor protein ClpS
LPISVICRERQDDGGRQRMSDMKPEIIEGQLAETRDEVTEPHLYKVLIHNDDFTTKDFVVEMLVVVFNKSMEEATQIMWQAHRNGTGLCGIYPLEVAETKVKVVTEAARENGFPLKLTIEAE